MIKFLYIFYISSFLILFSSCTKSTIKYASVESPGATSTVRLAKQDMKNRFTIRPYVGTSIEKKIKLSTEENELDAPKNQEWNFPNAVYGFDFACQKR